MYISFIISIYIATISWILADSYDDSQVKYEWSSVKLREKDMTEFYVDKESLKVESTMFITGTGTGNLHSNDNQTHFSFSFLFLFCEGMFLPRHHI